MSVMDFVNEEARALTVAQVLFMATMSFTTVFYVFAWVYPKAFATTVARALGRHPVDAVATVCYAAKVAQVRVMGRNVMQTRASVAFSSHRALIAAGTCVAAGSSLLAPSRTHARTHVTSPAHVSVWALACVCVG